MKGNKRLVGLLTSLLALVVLLAVVAGASYVRAGATAHAAGVTFQGHKVNLKPIYKLYGSAPQGKVLFTCQRNRNPQPVLCYGPDQIRTAYGVNTLLGKHINGKGSSITIIDAFGSPTIAKDLQAFDAAWGLPNPTLHIYKPFGVGGSDFGWAVETSLDVEWSHVWAQDATINLVVARTNDDVDLYNAIKFAVDNNIGDTLSQSFGENESCTDPALVVAQHKVYREAANKGISVFASSGDFGSAQPSCNGSKLVKAVSFPAVDPLVTAVGGTQLTADARSGKYIGETAWNESGSFGVASGGGFSKIYPRPRYQNGVNNESGRGIPDVALNASLFGGVLVFITDPSTGQLDVFIVGGTSVSSPEWAGMIADGVQLAGHRLGFLNGGIYKLGKSPFYPIAFHDITSGNNILLESGIPGYRTRIGWDPVTGWGTPNGAYNTLRALVGFLAPSDSNGL